MRQVFKPTVYFLKFLNAEVFEKNLSFPSFIDLNSKQRVRTGFSKNPIPYIVEKLAKVSKILQAWDCVKGF